MSEPDSAKLARGRELDRCAASRDVLRVLTLDPSDNLKWPEPATIPEGCPYPLFED